MSKPDLSGRTPTVQRAPAFPWPRWRITPRAKPHTPTRTPPAKAGDFGTTRAPPKTAGPKRPASGPRTTPTLTPKEAIRPSGALGGWLAREAVALIGMTGAALTVLAQLAWAFPLSRPFMAILGWWMTVSSDFWLGHYDTFGFYPHAHLQAAIALAFFLAIIGLGARISAILYGTPLQPSWGFLDGMTWPSLAIMGALGIIFLLGYDPDPASATYENAGGKETVKYLFAITLTIGYALGDFLGQRGFHVRLYRLAALLILLLALNHWLLSSP
jgi:hypothetical protein